MLPWLSPVVIPFEILHGKRALVTEGDPSSVFATSSTNIIHSLSLPGRWFLFEAGGIVGITPGKAFLMVLLTENVFFFYDLI